MRTLPTLVVVGFLLAAPAARAAAQDPLDARVTISFQNAAAADVLGTLARAAGLALELRPGDMKPVTITLTNARLSTALYAVCDNASCSWLYDGGLKVTPIASDRNVGLPPRVSFELQGTPAADVFRALAAVINVPVTVDPDLPTDPANLTFKNAATADVLNMLCQLQGCNWSFDVTNGLRVTRRR